MFVDVLGKTRVKVALNVKVGEGASPRFLAEEYLEFGFDAIALTENWEYKPEGELSGIKVMSGCEYTVGGLEESEEAYHIIGVGMTSDPEVPPAWKNMKKTARAKAKEIINMIQKRNGMAIVALPAHNRNKAEELLDLGEFDAIEIFNSEIEYGGVTDGYAGEACDKLSAFGVSPALVASNGISCYEDEDYICAIMVEATEMDTASIIRAIRRGRYYTTEGPEIHIERIGVDRVRVVCTPAIKIEFFSDTGRTAGKIVNAENLIEADYVIKEGERFVRAEVTDENGLRAWSSIIRFDDIYR